MGEPWREIGERVYVRRHASLDLNTALVVGDGACLVIDTRCSLAEGRDLADAVRRVTPAPWAVVTTHAHFDHCFGTGAFVPAPVWAHVRCAAAMASDGGRTRARIVDLYEQDGRPDVAREIHDSPLVVPDRLVERAQVLDVGGRKVDLRHLGRGHTDHDLVVLVPDADVVLAGDLVEQDAPPQFRDGFPLDWPATLDALLAVTDATVVVPGHGDVVDRSFVAEQQESLVELARCGTEGYGTGRPAVEVAADLRSLGAYALEAVERTYWQIAGG